jgi:hemoglobin
MTFLTALLLLQSAAPSNDMPIPHAMPGEEAIDPYEVNPHNAGATPFKGDGMAKAFGGQEGIRSIVDRLVADSYADPVIGEIFESHDRVRLSRTLYEQFCFILNAGCSYSGRDMKSSHKDLGVMQRDMNRLVEILQRAMAAEGVGFQAQNRFLSKLAPMRRHVVN